MVDSWTLGEDLVGPALQGDAGAFTELVIVTQDEVRLFLAARAPDLDLVEECLQATYVTAYERLGTFAARGTLLSWLKGIANNHLREELRRRRRERGQDALSGLIEERIAVQHEGEETDDVDRAQRLRRCLERLQPRARQLLELHHAEGFELNRLAQRFRRTRAALAKVLFTTRRALRACVDREVPA